MTKNFLALIFPEYDAADNIATANDWKRNDLPDDETLGKFLKDLHAYVDFYRDEECDLLFDSRNALAFMYCLNVLHDCYPSREREFRLALKNLEDWRKHRVSSPTVEYTSCGTVLKDEMRAEIASRMSNSSNDSYLLVVHIPGYVAKRWELSDGVNAYAIDSLPLAIKSTFEWLSAHHHPQRCYNWNRKHGENGKGAFSSNKGDEVSVLLCSRDHAEEILQKAIGVPKYDTLYCFDFKYGKYMVFKAECKYEHLPEDATSRSYHSYHADNDTTIPNRVKQKLDILENR